MPILNFKPQFVEHIKSGRKKHTIRAKRKYPCKVGDKLYLYTGLRTKKTKKIAVVDCVKVEEIEISILPCAIVTVDGIFLDPTECNALAYRDGFKNFEEMLYFWVSPKNRLPFKGDIIHWK